MSIARVETPALRPLVPMSGSTPGGIELTSSEAAELLDVHPSTVKRWCSDGSLRFDETPGGHRRIPISSVMSVARERDIFTILTPFHPYEPHVWSALREIEDDESYGRLHALALQWTRRGEFERLEQLFLALGRSNRISFCDLCDHAIRGLMARVGEEWTAGKLRIGDEHMLSQTLTSALLTLRREWLDARIASTNGSGPNSAPAAVVGTLEGNHHQLGALCVRVLLERAGWAVYYPGPDVPVEDFGLIQKSREASLVCIALPPAGSLGDVTRCLSVLRGLYDRARPYAVVFGGSAHLDLESDMTESVFTTVDFLSSCSSLSASLADGLGRNGGAS